MQTVEMMIGQIGELRGSVGSLERMMHRELHAIRRELIILHKRTHGGHGRRWLNWGLMAATFLGSMLGILKPEVAAAILKGALLH